MTTADGGVHRARVVVNAAGAWADVVAAAAGLPAVGLSPLRRTIFMVKSPTGERGDDLPTCSDVDQSFYVNPDGTQFLCSPADETPCPPSDAKPDQLEIARAIDAINAATTLDVRSIGSSWAGLRTFAPDRNFVVGEDPEASGFFWLAGQGGYGIQTAPAAARLGAAMVLGRPVPADLVARGLDPTLLAPRRTGAVGLTSGLEVVGERGTQPVSGQPGRLDARRAGRTPESPHSPSGRPPDVVRPNASSPWVPVGFANVQRCACVQSGSTETPATRVSAASTGPTASSGDSRWARARCAVVWATRTAAPSPRRDPSSAIRVRSASSFTNAASAIGQHRCAQPADDGDHRFVVDPVDRVRRQPRGLRVGHRQHDRVVVELLERADRLIAPRSVGQ